MAVLIMAAGPAATANGTPSFTVTPFTSAADLVGELVGSGITIVDSSITYTGATAAAGTFAGGAEFLPFDTGIVLTSGNAANLPGHNNGDSDFSASAGQPGYSPLNAIAGQTTYDATVLSFSFIPSTEVISFQFVFGSDEYNEYVGSSFNDVFAFFLNGTDVSHNIALVPATNDPITINTINKNSNSNYYFDNSPGAGAPLNTKLDGLTGITPPYFLFASGTVVPNEINTITLAIADSLDHSYDSAVFLAGSSFVPAEYAVYDFTYYYLKGGQGDAYNGPGDSYQGKVCALSSRYQVGDILPAMVADVQVGYYQITGLTIITAAEAAGKLGQVEVNSYLDSESGQTCLWNGTGGPMGVDYLGSEAAFLDSQGDILLAGDSQYYFGGSQHQEVNFLQETSFLSVLGNGQVWIGLAQSTPDYSLYYAQALDDPSASYVCLYSKIDEGTDWVSYFFYFKSATGGAYLGLGYDNATETTGYLIGQEEGNPDNTFTGFYTQIAEKTYNYVYNFNNGDMFGGTGYADFPAGYFYGSSPMSMGFFSGQYYFSPTPTYPAMSYWSLVYSVALLDYLEQ